MENQAAKTLLREQWKQKRREISNERRVAASIAIYETILPIVEDAARILSYVSFYDELDTSNLNDQFAKSGKLVLPRVAGNELELYEVRDPLTELRKGGWCLMEPDNDLCKAISPSNVAIALVPALAFDAANHRLGFGKGFYDRFLEKHGQRMITIGIGFSEQFSPQLLPSEKHDVSLTRIVLV